MNSCLRFFLATAALSVASKTIQHVDAAAFVSSNVTCLPDTNVCIGWGYYTSPSPAQTCEDPEDPNSCTTTYVGGWSWTYTFVEGLEEGTDVAELDVDEVTAAETGLVIEVRLEDDEETCEITVGNATCDMCSAAECVESSNSTYAVTYDCSNVDMGTMSLDCTPLTPIFYPLEISGNETDASGTGGETGGTMVPTSGGMLSTWSGPSLFVSTVVVLAFSFLSV